ncbi:testis development-related protein-like [Scleropages formosus]|uniref:Si:ch211-225h24.2 n=1 Tax=Scleropages formosus TaxID=113540 RepID=A0A0P7UJC2_SCLFO|nr:testis development-related protein-like [Scleropages formosus]KPP61372.1 testis development-related protein-like [Scleropages formosus]
MFKRSKSKVLVESASEGEDEEQLEERHPACAHQAEEPDHEEDIASPALEEVKVKVKPKKLKKDKKLFPQLFAQDDQHFLLTGVSSAQNRGTSSRKGKEEEKGFWDSVTMTMKQITPTKRMGKMEGWEPPSTGKMTEVLEEHVARDSVLPPNEDASWTGFEEDSSRYTSLSDPPSSGVRWTTKAKGKLAGIRRRSRGSLNENWEGLK